MYHKIWGGTDGCSANSLRYPDLTRIYGRLLTSPEISPLFTRIPDQCQIEISRSAINNFVRSQSGKKARPSKRQPIAPIDKEPAGKAGIADPNPKTDDASQNSQPKNEVFQRIAALKKRPATASSSSKLFEYDPNEPLQIERAMDKKNSGE